MFYRSKHSIPNVKYYTESHVKSYHSLQTRNESPTAQN